jgi:hypothetical protein
MKENYFENEFAEFWLEDGIIIEVFKPSVKQITYEIAKKVVEDRLKFTNGIERPMFIDMSEFRVIDKKARDYFGGEESNSLVSAAGIILHSYIAWLAGKLFLSINKPKTNIQLFKTKQKALEWLQQFVPENQL